MVYWLRPILVPFVVSLFVVSGITPILETMERVLHVNRLIASVIAFVSGLVLLALLSLCLWLSVQQIASEGLAYRTRVNTLLTTIQDWVPSSLINLTPTRGDGARPAIDSRTEEEPADKSTTPEDDTQIPQPPTTELELSTESNEDQSPEYSASFRKTTDRLIRQGLGSISAALFEIFSTSVVVLIYVFFIILGSAETVRLNDSVRAVDRQVREYLFLKTNISIVTGMVFGAALWAFGVPMALTFGLLAFLLNYIPNVGPVVASLLPIPFILLSPDGNLFWMCSAISVTMAVQVISGSVVEPKLMGESSDIHPVVILLALMFWGMMWGITGMFLATPITAGIKIILDANPTTRPAADILAGRFQAHQSGPTQA